jgi:hypothetical protein
VLQVSGQLSTNAPKTLPLILPAPVPRSRRPGSANRVALAQAMALGFGVIENARMTPAAAQISALAEEIRGAISG